MLKELEKELETTKNPLEQALGEYILALGQEVKEKTTLKGCAGEVAKKAKAQSSGGCAVVEDAVVYSWAREYFGVAEKTPGRAAEQQAAAPRDNIFLDVSLEDLL